VTLSRIGQRVTGAPIGRRSSHPRSPVATLWRYAHSPDEKLWSARGRPGPGRQARLPTSGAALGCRHIAPAFHGPSVATGFRSAAARASCLHAPSSFVCGRSPAVRRGRPAGMRLL
jgi:hypothetical protein